MSRKMDNKYESILLSKPFKFLVGPQKKQFMMHEAAVAILSKTLERLLNGGMKESNEHCVCWEDTDEKTFIRFGEWAYTGDYKSEVPLILLDASQIAITTEVDDVTEETKQEPIVKSLVSFEAECVLVTTATASWRHCSRNSTFTIDATCNTCSRTYVVVRCPGCGTLQFKNCPQCRGIHNPRKKRDMISKFNALASYAPPTIIHTPRKNIESCEDYSDVFLSHARLYVLADKYDIPELRQLSVHKLYATLKEFVLYPERMGDIIGLVKYAFRNTVGSDKLRTLMVEYCACIVEVLCESEDFEDLINDAPDFAYELIKQMGNRLD
ncbi:hypothetical protein V8C42DRAFT_328213 [Trichoderma barbatum]